MANSRDDKPDMSVEDINKRADAYDKVNDVLRKLIESRDELSKKDRDSLKTAEELKEYAREIRSLNNDIKTIETGRLSETKLYSQEVREAAKINRELLADQMGGLSGLTAAQEALYTSKARYYDKMTETKDAWLKMNVEAKTHKNSIEDTIGLMGLLANKTDEAYKKSIRAENPWKARIANTGAEIVTGDRDIEGSIGKITGAMKSMLPSLPFGMGGILGLMLYGKQQDALYTAVGETANQMFDRTGTKVKEMGGLFAAEARNLTEHSLAEEGAILAVTTSMAGLGISAADATQKIEGFTHFGMKNMVTATLAADKALELPSGTLGKMSATLARDFNMNIKETFTGLMNVGAAARASGQDMASFLGSVLENTSSLRMLNANIQSVAMSQEAFGKTMMGRGFNTQFSQSFAAAGVGNATGAVAGLSTGMASIIGQRMGLGGGDELDAWYALKSPNGRNGKVDTTDAILEMQKLAKENGGGSRAKQSLFLQQTMGVDMAGAEYIMDAQKHMGSNGKMSDKSLEIINRGLGDERSKTSELVALMKELRDGVAHIGSGILLIIVATLKAMALGVQGLLAAAMLDRTAAKQYFEASGQAFAGTAAGVDRLGMGKDEVSKAVFGYLKAYGLNTGWKLSDYKTGKQWEGKEYGVEEPGTDPNLQPVGDMPTDGDPIEWARQKFGFEESEKNKKWQSEQQAKQFEAIKEQETSYMTEYEGQPRMTIMTKVTTTAVPVPDTKGISSGPR